MICPNCNYYLLEDVQATEDRIDYWCSNCKCGFLEEQLINEPCPRCGKLTGGIHTCTPSKSYRLGYEEGFAAAVKEIDEHFARIFCHRLDKSNA